MNGRGKFLRLVLKRKRGKGKGREDHKSNKVSGQSNASCCSVREGKKMVIMSLDEGEWGREGEVEASCIREGKVQEEGRLR